MVTKAHDKKLPQAVRRLSAILGQYIIMYNQIMECCQQNLQVQKTVWLDDILNAVILRIIELKHQLEKLEGSRFQFLGYGLIEVHHTVYDIEMTEIPKQLTRPKHVQAKLVDIFTRVKEKREEEQIAQETAEEEKDKPVETKHDWWDAEANEETSDKEPVEEENIPETVIDYYHKSWDLYDVWETMDVKERHVDIINLEDAIMQVQLEVLPEVDEHMRKELRKLKLALKNDYERNEEEMPVNLTKRSRRKRAKKTSKSEFNEKLFDMIESLIQQGFVLEYPKKKLEDFIGDSNFGGEDLRSQTLPALPFHFEIRQYWWERCRDVTHGMRKILLVGPDCSGRTNLIYALASINDAVLFQLDPYNVQGGLQSAPFLKRLVNMVVTCAKALQPSVIRIKHVEKLFYSKIPPAEADMNLKIIKYYFITKFMKNISKTDNITVIGTCTEPWLAKTSALLQQFPDVLLMPNNGYSLVVQVLKEWVYRNKVIPADLNVSNLAHSLQGYSFGYIQDALDKFMSADRIIKIAAYGLSPMEVFDFILADKTQTKIDYDKYLNWYNDKTAQGRKEMKHLEEQRQFQAAFEKYVTMKKKKAKSAPSSTTPSYTGL
uniref:ATPase AAA-type core domain-containing protein n=1 Tax=Heliothis virescens TaxID=7102 RepID=A0A2A4J8Q7_HELVI